MPHPAAGPLSAVPLAPGEPIACDLFCTVIDNFGDIGVCWRVARQLAHEHGWQVRLFVDDLHTFARLLPEVDPDAGRQTVDAIVIEHWHAEVGDALDIADVVIEAFACELPGPYLAAMARRARRPVWINLEYLSAEDWVADFHLRPSPHPRYPLLKTFFFPGLSAGTGGVPKERDLDTRRAAFDADPSARAAWWQRATGGPPPAPGTTVVSLFAYENPAVDALLAQWRDGPSTVVALVPVGRLSPAVARFFGVEAFEAGAHVHSGNLTAHGLAFVPQVTTTRCCGSPISISCAARIRSCARNGRASRSCGTSTRRPTTCTCPSSTPRSRTCRPASPMRRAWRSNGSGMHGTAPARPTGPISGNIAPRCTPMHAAGPTRSRPSAISRESWRNTQNLS